MADISVDPQNNNPEELVSQGIKAYKLHDYNAAVTALSRATELMVAQHGDKGDPLGKVYLYYGKALLEVYREEAEPLGDAVACEINSDSEEEAQPSSNAASSKAKDSENVEKKEGEAKQESMNGITENKPDSVRSDDDKPNEDKNGEAKEESQASSTVNEPSNSGTTSKEPENNDCATDKPEEEPTDLQLAWEILELAKLIFEQRADVGKKELADTLVTLGEVSMESENFESAIADIKQGLEIQKQILSPDNRNLAETYYKLAVALYTNNQFDEATENFNTSLNVLKTRVENLKKNEEEEKDEIKDIESLIPEIEERIADIKSYKKEAVNAVNQVASVLTEKKILPEASGPSSSSSASEKQANDISHLVKRKRKLEDIVEDCEASNPNKKQNTV